MKMVDKHRGMHVRSKGFALTFALILVIILMLIGFAVIKVAQGTAVQSILFQNESIAMSNAEAAYENAIYWMSGNPDLLLDMDISGTSGTITFPNSTADYKVEFYGFVGYSVGRSPHQHS